MYYTLFGASGEGAGGGAGHAQDQFADSASNGSSGGGAPYAAASAAGTAAGLPLTDSFGAQLADLGSPAACGAAAEAAWAPPAHASGGSSASLSPTSSPGAAAGGPLAAAAAAAADAAADLARKLPEAPLPACPAPPQGGRDRGGRGAGAAAAGENDSPLYQSDDFRINCYKIAACNRRAPHDWKTCPFVHPGEHGRRRPLSIARYQPVMCAAARRGEVCAAGDTCDKAHNVFEMWLHPDRYRTQICIQGTACTRKLCFFAHSPNELRRPPVRQSRGGGGGGGGGSNGGGGGGGSPGTGMGSPNGVAQALAPAAVPSTPSATLEGGLCLPAGPSPLSSGALGSNQNLSAALASLHCPSPLGEAGGWPLPAPGPGAARALAAQQLMSLGGGGGGGGHGALFHAHMQGPTAGPSPLGPSLPPAPAGAAAAPPPAHLFHAAAGPAGWAGGAAAGAAARADALWGAAHALPKALCQIAPQIYAAPPGSAGPPPYFQDAGGLAYAAHNGQPFYGPCHSHGGGGGAAAAALASAAAWPGHAPAAPHAPAAGAGGGGVLWAGHGTAGY
ncbi:hypothetical protein Rsub_08123 [Raphidocelis subcapitata]|uniref:AtC3H23-like CCCH zinc finger domain-containing protein n=1 Tax=Raphidocelis subcapitata TaxID=307507 RepID=A0A2V0PAI7_9CHLO|nr:hypothetical protein Rsub_08123 [Raphidocelis subcapitata]|eukprot:GBF94880.1 hypothetical protein Rsub_08123 [Raphidocelis subcapitata]